jgi:hypothetical protein
MNPNTLAAILKPYRSASIAEAANVTVGAVVYWKAGKSFPTADKWQPLAAFLRTDVGSFFELQREFQSQKAAVA